MTEQGAGGLSPEERAPWRIGSHYGIHVYESDRPVGTFLTPEDAQRAVDALARLAAAEVRIEAVKAICEQAAADYRPNTVAALMPTVFVADVLRALGVSSGEGTAE